MNPHAPKLIDPINDNDNENILQEITLNRSKGQNER